jgi:hypothetical protein
MLGKDDDEKKEDPTMLSAEQHDSRRRGLLKKLIDHYSSTPIVEDVFPSDSATVSADDDDEGQSIITTATTDLPKPKRHVLTESERTFLEHLVRDGDMHSIETASSRLTDLFSPMEDDDSDTAVAEGEISEGSVHVRRNSLLQQELFRVHETQKVRPSHVLQRMSLIHRNSLLEEGDEEEPSFKDISSWVDGAVGVEVTENTGVLPKAGAIKAPFKILGTTADDVCCHPHVLSPPLMESLLAFVPESLTDCNFYLKYSLVRDGASLKTLLRNTRASSNCFLAIETVDGHVFGAFTSQPWRLSQGWYGSKDSFLFNMRHSRLDDVSSILEQVHNESEIQVYPYRSGNTALQHCSKNGIMMGQGELLPATHPGEHYGFALYLDPSFKKGTTSTSETFGNPCLVSMEERGATFEVSNIELWTLTPHASIEAAERAELSTLFLDGGRKNLNLLDIIVGGTI